MNKVLSKMNAQLKAHKEAMKACKSWREFLYIYDSYIEMVTIYKPDITKDAYNYFRRQGFALRNSYKPLFLGLNYRNRKRRAF